MTKKAKKKGYTLMVIPHSEDAPISFKVSISFIQIVGVLAISIFSVLMILGNDYFFMKSAMSEVEELRETVTVQREHLDYFAKETFELQERMRSVEKMDMSIRELLDFDSNVIINESKPESMVMASRASGAPVGLLRQPKGEVILPFAGRIEGVDIILLLCSSTESFSSTKLSC